MDKKIISFRVEPYIADRLKAWAMIKRCSQTELLVRMITRPADSKIEETAVKRLSDSISMTNSLLKDLVVLKEKPKK